MPLFRTPPLYDFSPFAAEEVDGGSPRYILEAGIEALWKHTRGEGVVIGNIDTGVDAHHVQFGALAGRVKARRDFTRSTGGWDDNGHGTHTAVINATMAPAAELVIAKSLNRLGIGGSAEIAEGIRWLVDQGAHVISASLGGPVRDPMIEAACAYADAHHVPIVAAAGNNHGAPVAEPAAGPHALAVSAIDWQRRPAAFTNIGPEVDVCAFGVDILSGWIAGGWANCSGTSMATPQVAGVMALYVSWCLAQRRGVPQSIDEWYAWIEQSTEDLGPPGDDVHFGLGMQTGQRVATRLSEPALPIVDPGGPAAPPAKWQGHTWRVGALGVLHWPAHPDDDVSLALGPEAASAMATFARREVSR